MNKKYFNLLIELYRTKKINKETLQKIRFSIREVPHLVYYKLDSTIRGFCTKDRLCQTLNELDTVVSSDFKSEEEIIKNELMQGTEGHSISFNSPA